MFKRRRTRPTEAKEKNAADKIRVLVVDDSALMCRLLSDIFNADADIEVIATARDGQDALDKVLSLRPDVVTLDIEMPRVSGLEALEHIMAWQPTPVLVVSGVQQAGLAVAALERGAFDFVAKPSGPISMDLHRVQDDLLTKVRLAAAADASRLQSLASTRSALFRPNQGPKTARARQAVVIAASTGGPQALHVVLSSLPADLPAAVLVVQHMPPGFTRSLAERLDQASSLRIKEAQEGDAVLPGHGYVAPGGSHMVVEELASGKVIVRLSQSPPVLGLRPAANLTLDAVAKLYGAGSVGVILTGMGTDGTEGLLAVKAAGGLVVAQDQDTSVVYGMPRAALESGCVDRVLPLDQIATEIVNLLSGPRNTDKQKSGTWRNGGRLKDHTR